MPLASLLSGEGHVDSPVRACHLQARACRGHRTEERSPLSSKGGPRLWRPLPLLGRALGLHPQEASPLALAWPSRPVCVAWGGWGVAAACAPCLRLQTRTPLGLVTCHFLREMPWERLPALFLVPQDTCQYRLVFLSSPLPSRHWDRLVGVLSFLLSLYLNLDRRWENNCFGDILYHCPI